ncbi:hypothetical protein GT755_34915 [Herbidospora sp. NEAU-GS84]|uniref:Uncharacterized protein n=1 Tax=Herbidospora solisilvae TaxID=2696284 RepID=A0A7C9J7L3_9ACTN|nr:hypothetical protein [Herbidospora solisilvae]NAS26847.1 hypothetical protein [Herbidospora solisilvae]
MAVAWGPVRGRVVFDSSVHPQAREQQSGGFSWTGARSLLVTDWPAVYVHDTGGFGTAAVTALDPASEPDASVALADRSTRLVADVRLPGGRALRLSSGPLDPAALHALTLLGGRLLPDAAALDFVSPCAVSVTPCYEEGGEPAELTAHVVLSGGRLRVRDRGAVPVEWPVNRIVVTPHGPSAVEIRGGALLDGRFLSGAVAHLVTPQVRDAFLKVFRSIAAATPGTVGTSAPVTVRGLAAPAADCVLGEDTLEFQAQDSQRVLAAFDLADPALRVAGSAERFVIFNPVHGPVAVTCGSAAFGRRLHDHAALRAAAARTLTSGVFPAELSDGRPVALAFAADGLRVRGPEVSLRVAYTSIRNVEGTSERLRLTTDRSDLTVVGPAELIQALHVELRTRSLLDATADQIPGLLQAAVGLEEDYLLYTIFGPFYELHAALLGEGADLSGPVTVPDAAVFQVGLAELQRHLDQVVYVLPAFIRHRDAQLLDGPEPAWLKADEAALRAALAPVQRAAAEVGQLAAQVSRLIDLDPAELPKVDYGGAALSLGAAALVNPVFAVSGLSQAYAARNQGDQRRNQATAQSARGWTTVLDRWNGLVGGGLPVLSYVVTENVFPLRWSAARRLAGTASLPGVARRLATLDVLRRHPSGPGIRLRRGEIADHLRRTRDTLPTPRFADF